MDNFEKAVTILERADLNELTTPAENSYVDNLDRVCPMMYLAREFKLFENHPSFLKNRALIADELLIEIGVPVEKVDRIRDELALRYDNSKSRPHGVKRFIEMLKELRENGWRRERWLSAQPEDRYAGLLKQSAEGNEEAKRKLIELARIAA